MLKKGTFCYVVPTCRASPAAEGAVGKIVEVMAGPYTRTGTDSRAPVYEVGYRGWIYYCRTDKLQAINDPDADVGESEDGKLAT